MIKQPDVVEIGAAQATGRHEVSDHLEHGRIVLYPKTPLQLPSEDDLKFLREESAKFITEKNISYYPQADKVSGLKGNVEVADRVTRILKEHHGRVEKFLSDTIPALAAAWLPGTTSFRPMQERGRNLSRHASNELIHVDAGAYGATHGDRIFRFFTNINPVEPRVWRVKGTFPDLFAQFGRDAGIPEKASLREGLLDRAYTGFVRAVSAVLPMARSVDSSPYDRAMRRFHNFLKDSDSFQQDEQGTRIVDFQPMSSWMVFTDMVGHSCIAGQYMLSNTYVVPLKNCRNTQLTPWSCIQGGAAS